MVHEMLGKYVCCKFCLFLDESSCKVVLKGRTLNFLFILRCILTNLDLVVYRLRYYFRNVLNGLKHFMTKLNH